MNTRGIKRFRQYRAIFKSLKAGVSITQACKDANIDPHTLWDWRQVNDRLNRKVHGIIDSRIQIVEDKLYNKALEGSTASIIFFLCNRGPDRWHNVADIKNIIINQNARKDEDDNNLLKNRPERIVFTDEKI
jgi:hypothetical protein